MQQIEMSRKRKADEALAGPNGPDLVGTAETRDLLTVTDLDIL